MVRSSLCSASLWVVPALICYMTLVTGVQAQDPTGQSHEMNSRQVGHYYAHGVIGLGFDVYTSSDIEALVPEEFDIHALGFPFQFGVRGGFRHIAQIEYYKYSTSAHNIGRGGYVDGGIVTESVPMKLKSTDILFKINPVFWKWAHPKDGNAAKCLFLVLGSGDASYRDNYGDGFDGSGIIYGLELATISKYSSLNIGATYQSIQYETTRLFGIDIPFEVKAKRFLMYVRLGLGYGK